MGCYCVHKYLDLEQQEEVLMVECERTLGLSEFASGKLCAEIQALAAGGKLDAGKLQQLGNRIHVEAITSPSASAAAKSFYHSLLASSDWSATSLMILAVLLGRGSSQSKAELLFSMYSRGDRMSPADAEVMAQDLCHIALVKLPQFCSEELESHDHLDAAVLVQNYAERLSDAKPYAEKLIKVVLFGNSTKELDFIGFKAKATTPDTLFLFSAKALRREAIETYRKVAKKHGKRGSGDSSRLLTV